MRVLLTGDGLPIASLVARDLLNEYVMIRHFAGSVTDEERCLQQVRHIEVVVHLAYLDHGTFEQLVDFNLGGSIKLAAAAEAAGIPFVFRFPHEGTFGGRVEQTLAMARQVLCTEYAGLELPAHDIVDHVVAIRGSVTSL
jgi:hypothetical protein